MSIKNTKFSGLPYVGAPQVETKNIQTPLRAPLSQEGTKEESTSLNVGISDEVATRSHSSQDTHFAQRANVSPLMGSNVLNLQMSTAAGEVAFSGWEGVPHKQDGPSGVSALMALSTGAQLQDVPSVSDLEALKSGDADVKEVAKDLKKALLSSDPKVLKKAVQTLQIAESYSRKAQADEKNYAGTGFRAMHFPRLEMPFNKKELEQVSAQLAKSNDSKTVDIMLMAERTGLLQLPEGKSLLQHPKLLELHTQNPARLPGSDGRESPRGGAANFKEEWEHEVKPGIKNIREAIVDTAKVKGPGCPYARGNHAKGVSFDDAKFKIDNQAPGWAKDLFGPSIEGGMIRISGSQTDPDQPDQEAHMPGIRIAFPVKGNLQDGSSQMIDITANTGSTTHAQTAAEHTQFTKDISVPKRGLANLRPSRAIRHALGGLKLFGNGKVVDRVKAMKNAVDVTDMAMEERFHEHKFFARHAFFVGGRYVQVRFEVVEPKDFPDPNKSNHPDARLNAVESTVEKKGLKLAMYMTELPDGNPDMVEQEGWKGLPETRLATIEVPPQEHDKHSAASKWFDDVPHIPGGPDKMFHAVGLGRHRVPIYMESGRVRNTQRFHGTK